MSEHWLGIDLGTSSVKVLLAATDGAVVAATSADYPIEQPQPGHAEQSPEAWWRAVVGAVHALHAEAPGAHIAAIGLSGQMHGTVLLDAQRQLLAPAVIWPDQRSQQQVAEITQALGAQQLYAITGSPVSTGFQAATVRWFQAHRPELWDRVAKILLPKDYLRFHLTGEFATDPSDAAGTLLLDEKRRDWSDVLLAALDIRRNQLPPILPSGARAGTLTADAARALGLTAGIPVATGAADTACSALGSGVVDRSRLLLTISTGGQLVQPCQTVEVDPRGRIHTFCSALAPAAGQAGWYQMGAILAAGLSLRWLRDQVLGWQGHSAYEQMTSWAAGVAAGADGLLFLPYLVGERTPHMDPTARGVIYGLTLAHGQAHLVRAVMEGVTFAAYDAYRVLRELGASSQEIVLAGGGASSILWQQLVADIFGIAVTPLKTAHQSALGAILLAGTAVGRWDPADTARRWARYGTVVLPDERRHTFYQQQMAAFRALYARNSGHFEPDTKAQPGIR